MNVNRTSDGSDGIFTRLAETRLFTDQKFLRFRVGENLDPPPNRPMLKSRCKREEGGRGGGKRRKEKKYEAFFNNSTLGTLGTLRLL